MILNRNGRWNLVPEKHLKFTASLSYNFSSNENVLRDFFSPTHYSDAVFSVRKDLHAQFVDNARRNLERSIGALTRLGICGKPEIVQELWKRGLDENMKRLPDFEWLVVYKFELQSILNNLKDVHANYILFADIDEYNSNLKMINDSIDYPESKMYLDFLSKRALEYSFENESESESDRDSE